MEEDFSLSEMLTTGMEPSDALVALSHHKDDLQSHTMSHLPWATRQKSYSIKTSTIFVPYQNETRPTTFLRERQNTTV